MPDFPPVLTVDPLDVDFGEVTTGMSVLHQIFLSNLSDAPVRNISIVVDNPIFAVSVPPVFMNPGDTYTMDVTYTAGALGTDIGVLTISAFSDNSPISIRMTANSVPVATKALSVNPSSFNFPETKSGTSSPAQGLTITNTGTVALTISSITVTPPFGVVSIPTMPATVSPGAVLLIYVDFAPPSGSLGYVKDTTAITITSDAPTSPDEIQLSGYAVPFYPKYNASGNEYCIVAIRNVVDIFNNQDLNCEAISWAFRWHDFQKPGLIKNYCGTALVYEDIGVATLNVYAFTHRDNQVVTLKIGDSGSRDIMDTSAVFTRPAGYAILSRIERLGNGGPVSLTGIIHHYAVEDVYAGTVQIPLNFTPMFMATGSELCEVAFANRDMKQFDNLDLDCEEPTRAQRAYSFNELGYESSLMRAEILYENLSDAVITVQAQGRRNQAVEQSMQIGNGIGDEQVLSALFDLDIQDEVITLTLSRSANDGPLAMTHLILRHIGRGEVVKS